MKHKHVSEVQVVFTHTYRKRQDGTSSVSGPVHVSGFEHEPEYLRVLGYVEDFRGSLWKKGSKVKVPKLNRTKTKFPRGLESVDTITCQ